MLKKLCTILLSALVAVPLWAQAPAKCPMKDGVVFAPRKGQWQVSLMLGSNSGAYNAGQLGDLVPTINMTGSHVGMPNGGTPNGWASYDNSGILNGYLNINGLTNNSLVNIVGLQGKYFIDDCWSVIFPAGMHINATPKKDYIEGTVIQEGEWELPAQKYVNATTTNNWFVSAGTDRYFKTSNPRIHPYVGASMGFQMARIETMEPYTGKMYTDPDTGEEMDQQVYLPAGKVGQMIGMKVAAVAGIEYSLAYGLLLGIECRPLAYRYDIIQIAPKGFDKYNLSHHNIKLIEMPVVKLGFRF